MGNKQRFSLVWTASRLAYIMPAETLQDGCKQDIHRQDFPPFCFAFLSGGQYLYMYRAKSSG
jgi:hypothetical protein